MKLRQILWILCVVGLGAGQGQGTAWADAPAATDSIEAAQQNYENAVEKYGSRHEEVAGALEELGRSYVTGVQWSQAELYLVRALKMRVELQGADHPATAAVRTELAFLYLRTGRVTEAEGAFLHALKSLRDAYGDKDERVSLPMGGLAELYKTAGRSEDATRLFEEMTVLLKPQKKEHRSGWIAAKKHLADLYLGAGAYDKAESSIKDILRVMDEDLVPEEKWRLAAVHNNLGAVYSAEKKYPDAETQYRIAVDLLIEKHGVGYPEVRTIMANWDRMRELQDRKS